MTARPAARTWGGSLVTALLATVDRPSWWALSLAGFLVRGGVLVLALPMWILPTPAQLTSLAGPSVTGAGLASPTPTLVAIVVVALVVVAVALLASSLVGGWIDAQLVRAVAGGDELDTIELRGISQGPIQSGPIQSGDIESSHAHLRSVPADLAATVRVVAHLPTLAAVLFVGAGVIEAATIELLSPAPSPAPLVARVVGHIPLPVTILIAAWLVGEAWGGLAVRELAAGANVVRSLARALRTLVSRRGLATLVVTDGVVLGVAAAMWVLVGAAFDRVLPAILDRADPNMLLVRVALLAASWVAGLWLMSLATTWRAAAWTAITLGIANPSVTPTPRRPS